MNTKVTEQDLQNFATLGFPASVPAAETASTEKLVESVLHVLETPSARLASAVALALQALATTSELDRLVESELTDDVRRRLGYLAERLSEESASPLKVKRRLAEFAGQLHQEDDDEKEPLTLLAATNPTLVRLYMKRADQIEENWGVYGEVELPTYVAPT